MAKGANRNRRDDDRFIPVNKDAQDDPNIYVDLAVSPFRMDPGLVYALRAVKCPSCKGEGVHWLTFYDDVDQVEKTNVVECPQCKGRSVAITLVPIGRIEDESIALLGGE